MKYMSLHCAGLKISLALFLLFLIFNVQFTHAQSIFYYIDEKGVMHFVDDESLIPEKYLKKSKTIIQKETPERLSEEQPKTPQPKDTKVIGEKKDKFGNPPSYWKSRYRALQNEKTSKEKELRELEEQRNELAKKLDSVRNRAYFIGDSQSLTEAASLETRLTELENRIKITISIIDDLNKKLSVDIYDELIQAGGDPSWLIMGE